MPAVAAKMKTRKDSEIPKTTSSEPSPQKMSLRKTRKEPTLELKPEEEEELIEETESSGGDVESEEEVELATPQLEKRKEMRRGLPTGRSPTRHSRPRSFRSDQ